MEKYRILKGRGGKTTETIPRESIVKITEMEHETLLYKYLLEK